MEKLKCREVFQCEEKKCPAYKSKDLNCWLLSGTRCRDSIQGKFIEKMEVCLKCEVFRANMNVDAISETINLVDKQFMEYSRIVKKAGASLRESEERYRDVYENAPDGIHSIGPDGTILEVNNTWLMMLGYKKEEVTGKMKLTDLLQEDGIRIFRNTFPELKKKGFTENIDFDLKRKDGTFLPVLINATAIYDENGDFLQSRSSVRDNSVKKKHEKMLEHAAAEWRMTFDSMPYGVMLLDGEHNIIRVNKYISTLTGLSYKEIVGQKCYKVILDKDGAPEECPLPEFKNTGATETFELNLARFNKYFFGYMTPFPDGENLAEIFVLSLVDITEIKDKEKKISESRTAFFNMLTDLDGSFKELKELHKSLIFSLVQAIDAKSPWTKGHSERVTNYAVAIAKEIGLNEKDIETLGTGAILHDIGKIGTYDVILDKPGKLTDEEFDLVKLHPSKGAEILSHIEQFRKIIPIIRHHHERIDGRGYPDGLKGEEIPFFARILHVADSFDSMMADRPYRPAPGLEYAISELKKYSGTQFDVRVAEAFLNILENPACIIP